MHSDSARNTFNNHKINFLVLVEQSLADNGTHRNKKQDGIKIVTKRVDKRFFVCV